MKRWFLAVAALLAGYAGTASADYAVIIANLNPKPDAPPGGGAGAMGGGMLGGPAGTFPGTSPSSGGMPPRSPGSSGGSGMPRGPGMPGGPDMPGAPRMGPPGGSGAMGSFGGFFPGGESDELDLDALPYHVIAVIEVEGSTGGTINVKKFEASPLLGGGIVKVKHKWGVAHLLAQSTFLRATFLKQGGKPMPTVAKRFKAKSDEVLKGNKPDLDTVLALADWALQHGLVAEVPKVMDKAAALDKAHPKVAAYLKVKAELDRPLPDQDKPDEVRGKLLDGYKAFSSKDYHYLLLNNSSSNDLVDLKSPMDYLENTFRGYYYWWALQGTALPVPKHRLVAVWTSKEEDIKRYQKILTAGPVVGDGFFARREGVSVLSSRRLDQRYRVLNLFSAKLWEQGYNRDDILKRSTIPGKTLGQVAEAQMMALLLKALEEESEAVSITNETSRQLVYASDLLPRNVAAPEWVLFGLGSFFGTPPEAPWPGTGAPSVYYLPRFKELKKKQRLEQTPYETLRKVVTDSYFRDPNVQAKEPLVREPALRKARSTAWSLTYFLARTKLDGLRRYFKEVGKMPRDVALDEEALLGCFARAFDAVDANRQVDPAKLANLANQWYGYMSDVPLEAQDLVDQIQKYYDDLTKAPSSDTGNTPNPNPNPNPGPKPPQGSKPPQGYKPPQGGFKLPPGFFPRIKPPRGR